jgi:hypothetical protein
MTKGSIISLNRYLFIMELIFILGGMASIH